MIAHDPVTPTLPALFPPLAPAHGQVHLHLVSLACPPEELNRLRRVLTEDELKRCTRLIDRQRCDLAIAGRGYLRELLGGYLGEDPERVLISEGEFGKPHLSEHLEPDSLSFNLSHAGSQMLVGVCAGCEIGVDLEWVREDLSYRAMAERFFSGAEQQELFSLSSDEQLAAFYRCWTRKEAYLKAAGSGFSQPANMFDVSLLPQHAPALLAHRGAPAEMERWTLRDVAVPAGYCAALAVEMKQPELKKFPTSQDAV